MLDNIPQENKTSHRTTVFNRGNLLVALLLVLVLAVGGYYRFVGLNWDDFTHLHPDERFLTSVVSALGSQIAPATDSSVTLQTCQERYPDDGGRGLYLNGGYFDSACSALNPNNLGFGLYVYGTLPLFIADVASDRYADLSLLIDQWRAELTDTEPLPRAAQDVWRGYSGAHLVWRGLNGVSDLLATVFLFLVGRRLHNKWTGLLAAALYIAAPLPIQKAHFATVNSMANFFGVLAFYFAVRVQDKGRLGDYAGFGVAFAAALASRINLVPLVVLILLAAGLRMLPVLDLRLAWGERNRIIWREFGGLVLAGILTIGLFRIFQPYAFVGPQIGSINFEVLLNGGHGFGILNPAWLDNIGQAQYLVSGAAESPPNWQWVNRMGYVFPISNMLLWGMGLALGLSAWLGWAWAGVRVVRGVPGATRNLLPVGWVLVYFAWIGNLWVMSMRYYLPLYPALVLMAAWALVEIWRRARLATHPAWRWRGAALAVGVLVFTQLWAVMFTNIYRNQLTRVQASHWVWENVPGDFSMTVTDAPPATPRINIGIFNQNIPGEQLDMQVSLLEPSIDYKQTFTAPADGTIREVHIPHLGSRSDTPPDEPHRLRVSIHPASDNGLLSQGRLTGDFPRGDHPVGEPYTVELETPVAVEAGQTYTFRAQLESAAPLLISGAIVSNEGAWDDPVPTVVCQMPGGITLADNPPPGLNTARNCNARNAYGMIVNGYALPMALDDIPLKREALRQGLDNSDYIIISSNRFYDTVSRNPGRWPLSNTYYDALFSGALGYELVATFQETFELGPLRVPDQHLPTMQAPVWLNEFEAEEAFHVYDHPVVFVFKRGEDYNPQATARILESESLVKTEELAIGSFNAPELIGVNPLYSLPADETPTQLQLKPEEREIQYENGTWSERFNRDSLVNQQPVITVLVWWLLIMLFGWVTFPLAFAVFPMLPDRGYSASKFMGLLAVGWLAWFATSLNVRLWHGGGLWLTLGLLAALSGWIGWQQRHELNRYIRDQRGQWLLIEAITLAAFLFFLGVRVSNPDLWHPSFGGEKPMDFAYFNAVLRSTTFPPIDPWHAGGYINYYYFGFVLVGSPVLMLGVVPSIAYNLIIPTIFAVTGIGAFGVAFNIVGALQNRTERPRLVGNPWTAGIVALLLAVVLGNLNTPRVFFNGLARMGGYTPTADITEYYREEVVQERGIEPGSPEMMALIEKANNPSALDRLQYNLDESVESLIATGNGFWQMIAEGRTLEVPTNRWHWAATRILAEAPVSSGGAITEMPYFTFLYGDLHAHMISMPMQLFMMLFLFHELIHAGQQRRRLFPSVLAITFGAVTVGMIRATNTWDWPTYLLLGVMGLGYAWWLKWRSLGRAAIVDVVLRVGGFISLSVWLALPYTRWYAAVYGSAEAWTGPKTPIWAYLTIHGVFVFLVLSLLVWETAQWLRSVQVRALRGRLVWVYVWLGVALALLAISYGLTVGGWSVSVLVVPMVAWAVVLFFRPGQNREMQFVLVLLAVALGATLGVEFIVIAGDIGRQNTVFKFYLQAWLMFAVVGGVVAAWLLQDSFRWRFSVRAWWLGVLGLLVMVAALYPIMATQARSLERMAPGLGLTLDGQAYMREAQHYEVVNSSAGRAETLDLSYDYNVIRWLQDNVPGTPVIMEAQSEAEYRWGSRIAINTGMPAVIGWNFHQRQQRTFFPMPQMVQQRVANVNAFYTTDTPQTAADILQHYEVSYVIVSALEQARYPGVMDRMGALVDTGVMEQVYNEDDYAYIFRVDRVAAQQLALGMIEITANSREVATTE